MYLEDSCVLVVTLSSTIMDSQHFDGIYCLVYKGKELTKGFHMHLCFRTIFERCGWMLVNADRLCEHLHF